MNEQTKQEILYALAEELDRQDLVEWDVEMVEEPGMRLYKRYTAKLKFPFELKKFIQKEYIYIRNE